MSCSRWPDKDPDEVLDYELDWQDADYPRLAAGETIATSTVTVTSGTVDIDSDSNDGTVVTVWLSGGTLNETCEILNRVVTSAGRTYDHSVKIRIRAH